MPSVTAKSTPASYLNPHIQMPEFILGEKRPRQDEDEDNSDLELEYLDKHCDQVRRQINTFIDNGGMKVGEFQKEIGANSNSYYRFMKQHGRDKGAGSSVYINAWKFFKRRELNKIPMPKKQKTVAVPEAGKNKTSTSDSGPEPKSKKTASQIALDLEKIASIKLDGEENDTVPIFDSCDEIRRKIGAYMRHDGVTQAEFVRALKAQFSDPEQKLRPNQLSRFRGNNGSEGGCGSPIFYSGYVFFEKLRIADGKPKTQHRIGMEGHWKYKGMGRREPQGGYFCGPDTRPFDTPFGVEFRKIR
jgi:hypothetical protein